MKKIELLCPASNISHISMAIDEKVDAVYGGLQNWNARNRLVNFTLDEYNEAILKLHDNNIKFYLTLNTLMLNEEIEEVISLFKNGRINLPDAFIVQDVGMAIIIKREFPKTELHFSTQFGAHNKEDLNFIESLKGSRAIIARELQLNEIEYLSKNSKIKLEAFVYGFQCMSYSGLCLWGSLLNNGSGNRGKCLTLCRDIYANDKFEGNLLYKPTLDCISIIDRLTNIDSLKIEGRRRNAEEIRKVVRMIKGKNNLKNSGHIFGEDISETNLFELVHSRIKPLFKYNELTDVNSNDIFVDFDENEIPIKYTKEINDSSRYAFSEICSRYKIDSENVSFEFKVEKEVIREIIFQNSKGSTIFFTDNGKTNNYVKISSKDFTNLFREYQDNVYRIKYNRTNDDCYYISMPFLEDVRQRLFKLSKGEPEDNLLEICNNKPELYVESRNAEIIRSLRGDKRVHLIFNVDTIEKFKNIDYYIDLLGSNTIYKLPLFNWKSEDLMRYYLKLEGFSVMFTRWSQIFTTRDIHYSKKLIDYTIYVWNKYSVEYLKEYGVDIFTASPELSFDKNVKILQNENIQFILGGNVPLMYTRLCFEHIFKCQKCNMAKSKKIINKEKHISFSIKCTNDYRYLICNRPILNDYTKKELDNISLRYIIEEGSLPEICDTIESFLENRDNYYDKLREIPLWKDSYQANVDISRC